MIATYEQLKEKDFENSVELRNQFPSLDNFKYRDEWWVIYPSSFKLLLCWLHSLTPVT
ncbi:type II toxin-antitoxin system HigB family toxin [Photorhabdus heterorhabditis subsp. aluminescens]|nr:type II toxin-antitoxin system HigB family toxin [Photorhabdus heterorhabditis subsp. aluminescens]